MSLDRIFQDLKQAMRERNKERVNALRLVTAAIKQIEVDERIEVDDARLILVLTKMAKQRKESISQYEKAERQDLIAQEEFELSIIDSYLPEAMSEQDITTAIDKVIAITEANSMKDMGKVMAAVKNELQGRADMAQVSALIKARLSQ